MHTENPRNNARVVSQYIKMMHLLWQYMNCANKTVRASTPCNLCVRWQRMLNARITVYRSWLQTVVKYDIKLYCETDNVIAVILMWRIPNSELVLFGFPFQLAKDLLHPLPAEEKRKHKLKRLVQHPNSYFMDVKCPGCYRITTVFSHAQGVVVCAGCATILCQPTGGRAKLTEGKRIILNNC